MLNAQLLCGKQQGEVLQGVRLYVLSNLALEVRDRGQLDEAQQLLNRAVGWQRAALQSDPDNPTYRQFLKNHFVVLAETLTRRKDHARAAAVARQQAEIFANDASELFQAGYLLHVCAQLAGIDSGAATDYVTLPVWSPDGSRIALNSAGGIDTIAPDGSNRKLIIKWGQTYSVGSPRWSPTGSHLIYSWWNRSLPGVLDIYRADANGGGRSNLTKDIEGFPFALGWR